MTARSRRWLTPEQRIRLTGWLLASALHLTAGALILRAVPVGDPMPDRPTLGHDIIMKVSLVPTLTAAPSAAAPPHSAPGALASASPAVLAPAQLGHGGAAAPIVASIPVQPSKAVASSTPTAQAAPSTLQGAAADQFRATLLEHIARFRRYPPEAVPSPIEGTVWVRFVMNREGHVERVWVDQGSGQPVLDAEALASVRRADPLPPIPPSLPERLDLTLPFGFSRN